MIVTDLDDWILGNVENLITWLEDWLSIKQSTLERMLIAFIIILDFWSTIYEYFILSPPHDFPLWLRILTELWLIYIMWRLHKMPSTVRKYTYNRSVFVRMMAFVCLLLSFCTTILHLFLEWNYRLFIIDIVNLIYFTGVFLFLYVVCCNVDNPPGRRRKLAIEELRKLFGNWLLPAPQGY